MIVGNIDFNTEALSQITEEQFREIYKGRLSVDMNEACKLLSKYFKKNVQKTETISRKGKKSKSK